MHRLFPQRKEKKTDIKDSRSSTNISLSSFTEFLFAFTQIKVQTPSRSLSRKELCRMTGMTKSIPRVIVYMRNSTKLFRTCLELLNQTRSVTESRTLDHIFMHTTLQGTSPPVFHHTTWCLDGNWGYRLMLLFCLRRSGARSNYAEDLRTRLKYGHQLAAEVSTTSQEALLYF